MPSKVMSKLNYQQQTCCKRKARMHHAIFSSDCSFWLFPSRLRKNQPYIPFIHPFFTLLKLVNSYSLWTSAASRSYHIMFKLSKAACFLKNNCGPRIRTKIWSGYRGKAILFSNISSIEMCGFCQVFRETYSFVEKYKRNDMKTYFCIFEDIPKFIYEIWSFVSSFFMTFLFCYNIFHLHHSKGNDAKKNTNKFSFLRNF